MADYQHHYQEIQSAGANLVAVSVDAPEKSEDLREQLLLTFPILSDTERRVIKDWKIYNAREKGGIAKPAVFVIDVGQVVRYAAVDTTVRRVSAVEVVSLLKNFAEGKPIQRKVYIPRLSDWSRAISKWH